MGSKLNERSEGTDRLASIYGDVVRSLLAIDRGLAGLLSILVALVVNFAVVLGLSILVDVVRVVLPNFLGASKQAVIVLCGILASVGVYASTGDPGSESLPDVRPAIFVLTSLAYFAVGFVVLVVTGSFSLLVLVVFALGSVSLVTRGNIYARMIRTVSLGPTGRWCYRAVASVPLLTGWLFYYRYLINDAAGEATRVAEVAAWAAGYGYPTGVTTVAGAPVDLSQLVLILGTASVPVCYVVVGVLATLPARMRGEDVTQSAASGTRTTSEASHAADQSTMNVSVDGGTDHFAAAIDAASEARAHREDGQLSKAQTAYRRALRNLDRAGSAATDDRIDAEQLWHEMVDVVSDCVDDALDHELEDPEATVEHYEEHKRNVSDAIRLGDDLDQKTWVLERKRSTLEDAIEAAEADVVREALEPQAARIAQLVSDGDDHRDADEYDAAVEKYTEARGALRDALETAREAGLDTELSNLENDMAEVKARIEATRDERDEVETRTGATRDEQDARESTSRPDEPGRGTAKTTTQVDTGGIEIGYDDIEKETPIGSGGNADVYRATVPAGDDALTVALKVPRMSGTLHAADVERVLEEARDWSKLDDHDHIVSVLDYGSEPLPWIAMEYMDGGTLGNRADVMSADQKRWTALAITRGVRHAHEMGFAHLDLKPENVLFQTVEDGWDVPKVADWGLSKHLLDHSRSVEGLSPHYAAPEQFDDDAPTDKRTDIYQLGAVFYELFTGQQPFEGDTRTVVNAVLSEDPTPPSEIVDVPAGLDDVLLTAMAKDRDDRYESILYLRDALREV
jgi:tetratricopeptide (TPR) repeat protein